MSRFRSYFLKNATLIGRSDDTGDTYNNLSNNSQNPVTEISYGTSNQQVSRFIFDINLQPLINRIKEGIINPDKIVKHILHMTNTIRYSPEYLGKTSYSSIIKRASAFDLDLFKVDEDWAEGSGYDFDYNDSELPTYSQLKVDVSNWLFRKNQILWSSAGAYESGVTEIIASQRFEKGNEDIEIDITDYINDRITGTTEFYGLGIKFPDEYEELETIYRQAVAFHTSKTNTFYEPYIETIVEDQIVDDRNYFYQDKENSLYLYVNAGGFPANSITIDEVQIFDHQENIIDTITGDSIEFVTNGVYKITYSVNSKEYPDSVLFTDVWHGTLNGRPIEYEGEFYLISPDQYYTFNNSNQIDFDNYHFYFWGLKQNEKLRAGVIRKVKLTIKEMYPNQDNFLPLDLEYRIFVTNANKYELDIIPFTPVNRTNSGYEFNIDTSWMIPQDYKIELRMKNGNYFENKQTLQFTVISDGRVYS